MPPKFLTLTFSTGRAMCSQANSTSCTAKGVLRQTSCHLCKLLNDGNTKNNGQVIIMTVLHGNTKNKGQVIVMTVLHMHIYTLRVFHFQQRWKKNTNIFTQQNIFICESK